MYERTMQTKQEADMPKSSYGEEVSPEPIKTTQETDNIFSYELDRLFNNLCRLEHFGHRLVDTNVPVKDDIKETQAITPVGVLPSLHSKALWLQSLNDRFNRVLGKLDELA